MTLNFQGPAPTSGAGDTIYAAWIEDSSGNNLQNVYICQRLIIGGLSGTAIPNWKRNKYPGSDIDGITGSSIQGTAGLTVTRDLDIGSVNQFRVCFEIDQSWNFNDNFYDRPSYTYRSGLIDLENLEAEYDLSLIGWMSNSTTGTSIGQQPKPGVSIPDWEVWRFMTDTSWIAPDDGMVSTLRVVVEPQ